MNANFIVKHSDQTILIKYFKYFPKYLLPFQYNFNGDIFRDYIEKTDVRILHYAGPKPTSHPDLNYMKYWYEARKKFYGESNSKI